MSKPSWREMDANANQSLTKFYVRGRGGYEPTSTDMPFDRIMDLPLDDDAAEGEELPPPRIDAGLENAPLPQLIAGAHDGEESEVTEYEIRQRIIGAQALMCFLMRRGPVPMDFYRQAAAAGRAMSIAPFNAMSMNEIAMMEGQTTAAHSWRCKVMSGEIELAGMKGSKLPGQKSKEASDSYKRVRKGNNNRKGGRKAAQKKAKQETFTRKLKLSTPPSKQMTFTRKMNAKPKAPAGAGAVSSEQ